MKSWCDALTGGGGGLGGGLGCGGGCCGISSSVCVSPRNCGGVCDSGCLNGYGTWK